MFRNSYDNDSVTYSPTGRLFQVEYALEAIKQGSAAIGLVSKTHAVLVALKRNSEELGSYQKKLIRVDDHLGVALAGLAPDARVLTNFLRTQAMSSKLVYNRPIPVSRAVSSIADKAQANTQEYGKRPYGVGLLVVGYDATGPHLYEFLPSGSSLEYVATSIGARSQAARTYLEKNFDNFGSSTLDELIVHGITALRDTLAQDKELNSKNTSIAVVGIDTKFQLYDDDDVVPWLSKLDTLSRASGAIPTEESTEAEQPETTETTETTETAETTEAADASEAAPAADDSMDTTE
ncbi:N-terminal nucleophile aminohydrolase [Nadsonia fulvescens var. elongata DSM 6958]|uniref:Proteasome subunit alpha type n=1 Tax=Nadsonia fulvescens var. elongata DSM 6958 TaxID=857566 RepID=A0A1E3PT42_9ASCO|nr:N-terminal nucleophile aminohydrolase [Nadsonia fulvescens var. elongata DSM 6958]